MSTNHTPNYSLSQWEKSDKVLMEDFNADNLKLDAALAAHDATLSTHAAQIARLGNCQIYTTTYTGNGQCGESHPCRFTFPKMPLLVCVMFIGTDGGTSTHLFALRDHWWTTYLSQNIYFSWSGNTVSFYSDKAEYQYNYSGYRYRLVALLQA